MEGATQPHTTHWNAIGMVVIVATIVATEKSVGRKRHLSTAKILHSCIYKLAWWSIQNTWATAGVMAMPNRCTTLRRAISMGQIVVRRLVKESSAVKMAGAAWIRTLATLQLGD
jgi:hypothetical protein